MTIKVPSIYISTFCSLPCYSLLQKCCQVNTKYGSGGRRGTFSVIKTHTAHKGPMVYIYIYEELINLIEASVQYPAKDEYAWTM